MCVCVRVMASNCFWLAFVELLVRIPLFFLFFWNSFFSLIFHFVTISSPALSKFYCLLTFQVVNILSMLIFHFILIFFFYLPFLFRLLLILLFIINNFSVLKLTKYFLSVIFLYPFICHSFQFHTLWQRFYIIISKF